MLGWIRRGKPLRKVPTTLKPVALLSPKEMERWHRLEGDIPLGHRILPLVPVVFFVEGDLPDELLAETVPFLQIDRFGHPHRAYLYEEGLLAHFLTHIGVDWTLLTGEKKEGERTLPSPPKASKESPGEALETAPPPEAPKEEPPSPPTPSPEAPDRLKEIAVAFWTGELASLLPGEEAKAGKGEPPKPQPHEGRVQAPSGDAAREEVQEGPEGVPLCPLCGSPMVLRLARKGKGAGQSFWGCSRYPACKGTRPRE